MKKITFKYTGWMRPLFRLYHMFQGWTLALGPVCITWQEKPPPPITVHYWKAYGYHGVGNLTTPEPMSEANAIKWVSEFGNVAYVDKEAGFIFYRPKE